MRSFLASLCLLESLLRALALCTAPASEFRLEGDYLIGGLFDIYHVMSPMYHERPEAFDCSSYMFSLSNYQRFQLMRFSVEEINNSTTLLPNVSLGYEIFDPCKDIDIFPGILKLISINGMIQPFGESRENLSKVMAVVGPFSSTQTSTVAPLFMMDLIPLVSYGAAATVFQEKEKFPSLLRTVHSNRDAIEAIVRIILHFDWHWVAFLNSDDDFGKDGLVMFIKRIKDTEICLAYTQDHNVKTNFSQIFKQIEALKIRVIIVFAPKIAAEVLLESALELNITNKVWIASDTWSLNKRLPKEKGIRNIGTVIGISQPVVTIPGFNEFMSPCLRQNHCEKAEQMVCSQIWNCTNIREKNILAVDPSFSFPVYSAVYAIAHALHNALQCGTDKCNGNITVSPRMVLAELEKSNFTLLNQSIGFLENGDPSYGSYSVVYWNRSGDAEDIGFYEFHPVVNFFINSTKIQWYTQGEVPTSICSPECAVGHAKQLSGIHKCCFDCKICPKETYINSTEDPYTCIHCKETEWSAAGSTSCGLRVVEYVSFTDVRAILIMVVAWVFVGLTLAMSVLFAIHYNTPVVRSAGGPMCFLILGCLALCTLSVFFYFDKPTISFCILRFLPFMLFYTVCLACFVVRSFQIVCIFKVAAKFPMLYRRWMKYHGQWLVITVVFVTQVLLLLIGYFCNPPKPYNDTFWFPDKIILGCESDLKAMFPSVLLLSTLCFLCFIFSYMGKHLPKNYNEAKAITFCLLLLILNWIIFATVYMLYHDKHIQTFKALAILSSLYSLLFCYFLSKCYIIIIQPHKNTQQYFQGLIQNYTQKISQ